MCVRTCKLLEFADSLIGSILKYIFTTKAPKSTMRIHSMKSKLCEGDRTFGKCHTRLKTKFEKNDPLPFFRKNDPLPEKVKNAL